MFISLEHYNFTLGPVELQGRQPKEKKEKTKKKKKEKEKEKEKADVIELAEEKKAKKGPVKVSQDPP